MFLDERYDRTATSDRFIIGCIVVGKGSWSRNSGEVMAVQQMRKTRRLQALNTLLNRAQGFAMLRYADIPVAQIGVGQKDYAEDVPIMSRRDNAWSILFAMTVVAALRRLRDYRIMSADVSLFHDPKSLTLEHRNAFHHLLRHTLPEIPNAEYGDQYSLNPVLEVAKGNHEDGMNDLQLGTSLAHQLCLLTEQIRSRGSIGRIECKDGSTTLSDSLSLFEVFRRSDSNDARFNE